MLIPQELITCDRYQRVEDVLCCQGVQPVIANFRDI